MKKSSPFKFLDAYEKEDKNIFFGRDVEIETLYQMSFQTNLILVYGMSGTGKTSLIRCGLANKFDDSDWFEIFIRRQKNINQSLLEELKASDKDNSFESDYKVPEMVHSLYLDFLRPVYLIFDQFEELFILGNEQEQSAFIHTVKALLDADLPCKLIFVIREEYLAHLSEFEKVVPSLFNKRLRVERMTRTNAIDVVVNTLSNERFSISLSDDKVAGNIIDVLTEDRGRVELTYLQVFLDKLYRIAGKQDPDNIVFTNELVRGIGGIEDILGDFLDEQLEVFKEEVGSADEAKRWLKLFVSDKGTKVPIYRKELIERLPDLKEEKISKYLDFFVARRILRPIDNDQYELTHDSLAERIFHFEYYGIPIPQTLPDYGEPENFLLGFEAYPEQMASYFYGRDEEIKELFDQIVNNTDARTTLVYGPLGVGKTSILKAGLIPRVEGLVDVAYVPCSKQFIESEAVQGILGRRPEAEEESQLYELAFKHFSKSSNADKPKLIILDQFEEFFIWLKEPDKLENLYRQLALLTRSNYNVDLLITIRDEYFSQLQDLELFVPTIMEEQVRIRQVNNAAAATIVAKTAHHSGIVAGPDKTEEIIQNALQEDGKVNLTFLQLGLSGQAEGDGNPVDELLDKEVNRLEENLPQEKKGVINQLLSLFVINGNRVQLEAEEAFHNLEERNNINHSLVEHMLTSLSEAGIIHDTEKGDQEVASNYLANRVFQKVETENRVLRSMSSTIRDRMGRGYLLDKQYYNYISHYLHLLDLNQEERDFVERSRRAIRRRRRLFNTVIFVVFLLLCALALWALFNAGAARKYAKEAEEALEISESSREQLESARDSIIDALKDAQIQKDSALFQKQRAEVLALKADAAAIAALNQKEIADSLRQEALDYAGRMNILKRQAEELQRQAEDSAQLYNKLRQTAQRNERIAQIERIKSEQLNTIITSWNVASRSADIEDPRLKALLAKEAYNINVEAGDSLGNPRHPSVMKALYEAVKAQNEALEFKQPGLHVGAVQDMIIDQNGNLYTTGSDGRVFSRPIINWNQVGAPSFGDEKEMSITGNQVHNVIALSDNGQQLLVAGEVPYFQIVDVNSGELVEKIPLGELEEIYACGFLDDERVMGLGNNQGFLYRQGVEVFDKVESRNNMVLKLNDNLVGLSFTGEYNNFAYEVKMDKLENGALTTDEFFYYGTPSQVQFGKMTSVAISNPEHANWIAYGFHSGHLVMVPADIGNLDFGGAYYSFQQHRSEISDLCFSPDGRYLAVASYDRTVSVWELDKVDQPSYQPMVFDDHGGWAISLAFSNDSKVVLVGGQDGSIYFWNLNPEDYADQICRDLNGLMKVTYQTEQASLYQRQSRKSKESFQADELEADEYLRYFGVERVKRVCN